MDAPGNAPDLIVLHQRDNVATALRSMPAGVRATVRTADGGDECLLLVDAIDLGHKAALVAIERGEFVTKHGYPMGRATDDIAPGGHVHVHNVLSLSREHLYPPEIDGGKTESEQG